MQNYYTKEGQLNWWLALLEIHKSRSSNPPLFQTQKAF